MSADIILDLQGITGECEVEGFEGQLQVLTWKFGFTKAFDSGTGLATGRGRATDLIVTKLFDKASPVILQHSHQNTRIPRAKLIQRKASGPDALHFLTVALENATVSNYDITGADGSGIPVETFGLKFETLTYTCEAQTNNHGGAANVEFMLDLAGT